MRGVRYFGIRSAGFNPWLESHWDRRLIREFNQAAYDECYLRICDLLDHLPTHQGMFGSSWWLDPSLDEFGPELTFLRRVPEEAGAQVFRVGVDPVATRDATYLSKRRSELHRSGAYRPAVYLLAWHRDDMLRWAASKRA